MPEACKTMHTAGKLHGLLGLSDASHVEPSNKSSEPSSEPRRDVKRAI